MEMISKDLLDCLKQNIPGLKAVYHYGSTAKGDFLDESDIDLGLLAERHIPLDELTDASRKCAIYSDRDISLVDIQATNPVLFMQMMEGGKVVLNHDPNFVAEYEVRMMVLYCILNEERKGILEDILKKGKVHG